MPAKTKKKAGHLAPGKVRRIRGIHSRIDDLMLHGGKFIEQVGEPLRADVIRSVEAADTIEIEMFDPDGELLRSKLLKRRVDVRLDGLWFRLVQVSCQPPITTMVFEDRVAAFMRLINDKGEAPLKMYRDQITRAEFVLLQVREVKKQKIRVYIPELHKVQPIETAQQVATATSAPNVADTKGGDSAGGGLDSSGLTVKGDAANSGQIRNGEIILSVGTSMGAPRTALVAGITAGIGESGLESGAVNPTSGASGVFQLMPGLHTQLARGDTAGQAKVFFGEGFTGTGHGAIDLANQGMGVGGIVSTVEGSDAGGSFYDAYASEAEKWVDAFSGSGGSISPTSGAGATTKTKTKRYAFERKETENAWDCTGRLAEEVNWQRFSAANVFYYMSEEMMFAQKPLMFVHWENEGLNPATFDWDKGKKVAEAQLSGQLRHWAAPPGTLIKLSDDYGPGQGKYLISEISSSLFSDDFTATAKTPMPELPEPAAETTTTTKAGESGDMADMLPGGSSGSLEGVTIPSTGAGAPDWGGAAYIFKQFLNDFMTEGGCSIGGTKETGHQTGGDHDPNSATSYAYDFGCPDTEQFTRLAHDVCVALGGDGSTIGSFGTFNSQCDGHTYRWQVLWHVPDHYDHIHIGGRIGLMGVLGDDYGELSSDPADKAKRAEVRRPRDLLEGRIINSPADTSVGVRVKVRGVVHGPCVWAAKILDDSHYGIPEEGDMALVALSQEDEPYVVEWWEP